MRWLALLLVGCASPPPPQPPPPPKPQIVAIDFSPIDSNLTTGDEIKIEALHGDKPNCAAGGNYQISGTWTLMSRADAELVVGIRGGQASSAEKTVARGSGDFTFTFEIQKEGPIEVFFQRAGGGSSLGGIAIRCGAPGAAAQ